MSGGHNDNPALFALATLGKLSLGASPSGRGCRRSIERVLVPLAANPLNRRELPAAFQALGAAAVAQLPSDGIVQSELDNASVEPVTAAIV